MVSFEEVVEGLIGYYNIDLTQINLVQYFEVPEFQGEVVGPKKNVGE